MTEQTTGQQAVNLLYATGFRGMDSGPLPDGSYAVMADIEGRTIKIELNADGDLVRAIPWDSWSRNLMRDHGWSRQPFVTTVESLGALLAEAECDGWCTGLQHREACPAHVVVW